MRFLDEVIEMNGHGIALLCVEGEAHSGMRIRDARGNVHEVASVSDADGLQVLLLPAGDANYFGRLFRDIRVDATRFEEVE